MESGLIREILIKHGARPDLLLWRNNTGQAWTGNNVLRITRSGIVNVSPGDVIIRKAHPVKFGLEGSPDIIGIGSGGSFIGIEAKSVHGRVSEKQKCFHARAKKLGVEIIIARTINDVERI